VKVPFDFQEVALPIAGLFAAMLLFFFVVYLVNLCASGSFRTKTSALLQDLRWNAFIRFGLIFFLPLQLSCFKFFHEMDWSDFSNDDLI
jgi:hypothetical protein